MGRTVPTYRNLLEKVIGGWDSFRRALRSDDKVAFDDMMNRARMHSSASGFNPLADPQNTLFMSILLEHEKEIDILKREKE